MKTKKYEEVIKNHEVKPNYVKNAAVSFFFGGLICLGGQLLIEMYIHWFGFVRETASTLALVTVILITMMSLAKLQKQELSCQSVDLRTH